MLEWRYTAGCNLQSDTMKTFSLSRSLLLVVSPFMPFLSFFLRMRPTALHPAAQPSQLQAVSATSEGSGQ